MNNEPYFANNRVFRPSHQPPAMLQMVSRKFPLHFKLIFKREKKLCSGKNFYILLNERNEGRRRKECFMWSSQKEPVFLYTNWIKNILENLHETRTKTTKKSVNHITILVNDDSTLKQRGVRWETTMTGETT